LSNRYCNRIYVLGDWVYFTKAWRPAADASGEIFYRMRTDGTGEAPF